MYLLNLTILFVAIPVVISGLCKEDHKPSNDSIAMLQSFCKNKKGVIGDRMCMHGNDTIGLDLSNCGTSELIELESDVKQTLKWLAINDNKFTLNTSISQLRSTVLDDLIINIGENCTGFGNKTINNKLIVCSEPINSCSSKTNDVCPDNSRCDSDGPSLFTCNCYEDWQSYKCLKQKGFPKEKWLISICVSTVVLIIIMRILQRPARKNGEEYKKMSKLTNTDFANPESDRGLFN